MLKARHNRRQTLPDHARFDHSVMTRSFLVIWIEAPAANDSVNDGFLRITQQNFACLKVKLTLLQICTFPQFAISAFMCHTSYLTDFSQDYLN